MATAPSSPAVRTPQLVLGVTDASQNRSKQFIPSAYAVGKLFTGVTLADEIDLNTYLTPGVSRVNTYRNGPPVTSPGYLVIHSVNPDEDGSSIGVRYRQIYYPDSTTETTPYTRVGTGTSNDAITWSTWTTMGGNWVCEVLTADKTAIVNYMYHSFGSWTLTLPDPANYVQGTRIGLTQWMNQGSVVYDNKSLSTAPDVDDSGDNIGALQYIFQIVPDNNGNNIWSLEVDNNPAKTLEDLRNGLQASIDTLSARHDSEMTELSELVDSEVSRLDNDKRRDVKIFQNITSMEFVYDDSSELHNLKKYDAEVMVVGTGGTIVLPDPIEQHGVRVVLHLSPTVFTTVTAGSVSETFTNTSSSNVLVVDFEVVSSSVASNYVWTVLEVG